ncbi:ATP-dependent DNA helicase RecG [Thermoclostridium caenicola]|uniref:ATP-dependent DNA helicase RecG n=1 Tax=Thermoclostridium caenicola TaxID=659425 RepID=A0A1M6ICR9_9FIRM|nr:ATP-dependent DNA helicase RecG [Thermoclostridium caenicola]SHJ32234.1 ATP-dependent DNA helicase RecG [Thermoclostridium caenicola]
MSVYDNKVMDQPLKYVKGVGENRARLFAKLGLFTLGDLLHYFPRDYEDRSVYKPISEAADGESITVRIRFVSDIAESRPRRNLSLLKAQVTDGVSLMNVTWFNQSYIKQSIDISREYVFFGTVKRLGARVEIHNPVFEELEHSGNLTGRIVPVYSLTRGITQNMLRKILRNALDAVSDKLVDILPSSFRSQYRLAETAFAFEQIHFPTSMENMEMARRRLVFEELLLLQLGLFSIKGSNNNQNGIRFSPVDMEPFLKALPFRLTSAQERVLAEIKADMESDKRMNRLIQGDVGSGKTIMAVLAIYIAASSGYQSAFMAPTEILAEQHYRSIAPLLEKFGIKVGLLTGGMKKKEKETIKKEAGEGRLDVLIGTHAVLEDSTVFSRLGLVITDEQHRFGVRQRARLSQKGENPDLLVMTATPIPRTLSLVLYGDLDVSIIDTLPPDRKPIKTYVVDESMRDRVYQFIRKNIAEGRQAYIVCPLVEESEELEVESATGLVEKIREDALKGLRVGLIHGKMKSADKDEVMRKFSKGELDVLVSTTVIEVGVNVPNANIMVIENAERFGLAQLHQLRGRVGRGPYQSYCILFNQGKSHISRQRMEILAKSNDGFVISEKDLELRGPGDIFGVRQHGLPEFRIANLYRDMEVLKDVQKAAQYIMAEELLEKDEAWRPLARRVELMVKEKLQDLSMN